MDHPTSPVAWICTPTSPEPNQPIDDIANQNNLWFLDFFSKVVFSAIFGHFGPIQHILPTPRDHPTSPVAWICTPTSPEPNQPKQDIANQNNYDFWIFLVKLSFLPFLSILAPEDPLLRAGLRKWGLWEAFWGYQAPLLTQYCQQNCSITCFSC